MSTGEPEAHDATPAGTDEVGGLGSATTALTPDPAPSRQVPGPAVRATVLALLLLAVALLGLLIWPFATPLYLAAVLAGVLGRWVDPLARRLHVRPGLSAALLTLGVALVVLLPLAWLVLLTVQEGLLAVSATRDAFAAHSIDEMIGSLPAPVRDAVAWIRPHLDDLVPRAQELLAPAAQKLAASVPGAIAHVSELALDSLLLLLALYALLVDGKRLVGWIERISPLPDGHITELLTEFRRISVAVLLSTLAVALTQALATLIGLLFAHAPQPVFFAFLSFLIALIPVLTPALVPFALALWMFAQGHWIAGGFLVAWTLLVVMTVDNVIRPFLLERGVGLHPVLLLFTVLGGVLVFGPVGLVAGPMVLSFFLAMVEMTRREFGFSQSRGAAPK